MKTDLNLQGVHRYFELLFRNKGTYRIVFCIFILLNTPHTEKSQIILYIIKNTSGFEFYPTTKLSCCVKREATLGVDAATYRVRICPLFPWSHQEERNKVLAKRRRRREVVVGIRTKICFRSCAKF